jgi:hypothetical protein
MRGRLVDVVASDAVRDDKPSERTTMDGQPPASYAQARLADMVFRAKLRRLEFETLQGKLIEAAILAVPDKLAPEVTALTDERQVHALLKAIHSAIQYAR